MLLVEGLEHSCCLPVEQLDRCALCNPDLLETIEVLPKDFSDLQQTFGSFSEGDAFPLLMVFPVHQVTYRMCLFASHRSFLYTTYGILRKHDFANLVTSSLWVTMGFDVFLQKSDLGNLLWQLAREITRRKPAERPLFI